MLRSEAVQRARAAHVTVQRAVVAVTQEAIRVCGGRASSSAIRSSGTHATRGPAALMRPWTQEIAMQQAWETALGSGAPAAAVRKTPRPPAKVTRREGHQRRRLMPGRLAEKVALITGGGSGIGRACALRFAEEGAKVCVADLDLAAATDTARKIDGAGRRAIAVGDTTDEAANDAMVRRCVEALGAVDILVAAAGVGSPRAPIPVRPPHTVLSIPTADFRTCSTSTSAACSTRTARWRAGWWRNGAAAASSISPPSCRACRRPAPPTA